MRKTSDVIKLVSLAWFATVGLTACGGGASTEGNQNTEENVSGSLVTSSSSPEHIAYEKHIWQNLYSQSRCGRCHSTGGQEPQFVHGESLQTAYDAGIQVADLDSPNDSKMVTIIRNGHKQIGGKSQACWLATDEDCADEIRKFITAWDVDVNGALAVPQGVNLVAPSPLRDVSDSKNFPADSTDFGTIVHTPYLKLHCAGCHTSIAANSQSPFFASNDVNASYLAAQQKMDLLTPSNSRFVLRLRNEFHNCWTNNCANDADEMEQAITDYANTITPTQVDSNLIISKAMKLQPPEAIVASGGERHTVNQIALWEFKTGTGNLAYDTSGISPLMNLSLSGTYNWVGGYGVQFIDGRAVALGETSKKLLNNIRARNEYSIEAWVIPANVVQQNKNIISYSGGVDSRNFTIAQNEYTYQFYNRSTTGIDNGVNGGPVLTSLAADEDLQATQQHIVMTYDPVNGRRMYVNGVFTDDTDTNDVGGKLDDWSDIFAFTLGNELGQSNPWQGTFRMVAIHNRVLSNNQITQNFKAGVGEKFFLLFSISHISGVPADSYIKVEAQQFDTYSYLFNNPVYVNLGSTVPAIDFPIGGVRIGINGTEAIVGQSFINLDITRVTVNNQEISRLGTVIELKQGSAVDDFFLSFETLGTESNPFVVAAPGTPADPPDLAPQSDIGVRTFSEINGSMSDLTGIPTSNSAVFATYTKLKQQLPSTEDINAFVPANIIGISQLAFAYCEELVDTPTTTSCERDSGVTSARECMFASFDSGSPNNFDKTASVAFGSTGSANRILVADALYDRMIGIPSSLGAVLNNAPTRTQITDELVNAAAAGTYPGNLVDRLIAASSTTKDITKALCASVLGSAAMVVQ